MEPSSKPNLNPSKPKPITFSPPKLLLPTIACFVCIVICFLSIIPPFLPQLLPHFASYMLEGILLAPTIALMPALALFLIYRLLEIIMVHHVFHPFHLLPIIAITLSLLVYLDNTITLFIFLALYLIFAFVTFLCLFYQQPRPLINDPIRFHKSFLRCAITSLVLGSLNFFSFIFYLLPTGISQEITGISLVISIFSTLPLQLTFTFITLSKLSPALDAKLLSHRNLHLIYACLFLAVASVTAFLAAIGTLLIDEYIPPHYHYADML